MSGSIPNRESLAQIAGLALQSLQAGLYPANASDQETDHAIVSLLPNTVHPIPGPAVGSVRLLLQVMVNPTTAAPSSCGAILVRPSPDPALILWKPFAIAQFSTSNVGGSLLTGQAAAFVLGAGETLEVSNALGAGPATLFYSWVDFPDDGITLIRGTFNEVPTTIIPVAPTGSFHRLLAAGVTQAANGAGGPRPVIWCSNVSTGAAQLLTFIGGTHITSQTQFAQNGAGAPVINFDLSYTTQELAVATRAAPTGQPLTVFGAYKTLRRAA